MNRSAFKVYLIVLLLLFFPRFAWALSMDSLQVSIAVNIDGRYVKPTNRKITIRRQPMPFYVEIKNISRSSQKFWNPPKKGGYENAVSIEIIDENGKRTIIKKRRRQLSKSMASYQFLKPEESRIIPMLIDPDDWKNVTILEKGKVIHFKARAIFQNGSKKIYSKYYEVTADIQQH